MLTPHSVLGFVDPETSPPPKRWETVALVITALATVFSVVTQWKERPVYAGILVTVALLVSLSIYYSPVVSFARERALRAQRNRVALKLWPEFLRLEKRFGNFINKDDSGNLRSIFSEICNRNPDELAKFCPPDYLNHFYPLLSMRHGEGTHKHETDLFRAMSELRGMVALYTDDYVSGPLKRLRNGQLLVQLPAHSKQHYEEGIEDFRERWVGFLDDFKEFLEKANNDLGYEPYHEAIRTYFERPKKFSP
jgi:hypothetical protein